MKNPQTIGLNRTGVGTSPLDIKTMLEATKCPSSEGQSFTQMLAFRKNYFKASEEIGTIPPPTTLKGLAKVIVHKLTGDHPEVFINKMGERIAFERSGIRLYDLLINKCQSQAGMKTSMRKKFEEIRANEVNHFELLVHTAKDVGIDPTVLTPDADISGIISLGLLNVVADPRITFLQSLEAILLAELADNDAWHILIQLANTQGMDEIVEEFENAKWEEDQHLYDIRHILSDLILR